MKCYFDSVKIVFEKMPCISNLSLSRGKRLCEFGDTEADSMETGRLEHECFKPSWCGRDSVQGSGGQRGSRQRLMRQAHGLLRDRGFQVYSSFQYLPNVRFT